MSYFTQLLRNQEPGQLFRYHPNGHVQRCGCGQAIFFHNTRCLACGSELGYHPQLGLLLNLQPQQDDQHWLIQPPPDSAQQPVKRCSNLHGPLQCNWLVSDPQHGDLCQACALNLLIPNLDQPGSPELWRATEEAKRRLVAQLIMLGLPVLNREQDPQRGLGFKLMRQQPGDEPVMTGHMNGVITINVAEADPAYREQVRQNMAEHYRTLLGHFRHESGHYYWDRLVRDSDWLAPCRELFGDERRDYQQALSNHYQYGPALDWQNNFISHYAASHPWEDWAETWAHYLHMTDTLNVALDFGIQVDRLELALTPFTAVDLNCTADNAEAERFLAFVNRWVMLSSVLNVLARTMGQADIYPFVLNPGSLRKMYFVHRVIAHY
ncbi:MAG: putative zinc-binding peptidase [Gammaproteobacteria bacterium]|nr:putative zinc-binding peptidase [Gammaproteobacteria bacterium]